MMRCLLTLGALMCNLSLGIPGFVALFQVTWQILKEHVIRET